jgi:hypothetical protein
MQNKDTTDKWRPLPQQEAISSSSTNIPKQYCVESKPNINPDYGDIDYTDFIKANSQTEEERREKDLQFLSRRMTEVFGFNYVTRNNSLMFNSVARSESRGLNQPEVTTTSLKESNKFDSLFRRAHDRSMR